MLKCGTLNTRENLFDKQRNNWQYSLDKYILAIFSMLFITKYILLYW